MIRSIAARTHPAPGGQVDLGNEVAAVHLPQLHLIGGAVLEHKIGLPVRGEVIHQLRADAVAVSARRPRPLKHFTSASGC